MKRKRGQVTLFIIAGVLIISAVAIYLTIQPSLTQQYDPKVQVAQENMLDCFKEMYQTTLVLAGAQGGYYQVPEPSYTIPGFLFDSTIPIYYNQGELHIPTIQTIEQEIETGTNNAIEYCIQQVQQNNTFDNLEFSTHSTNVVITEENVEFTTALTMTITDSDKTTQVPFDRITQKVPSDIQQMHEIATMIANHMKDNNEFFPFTRVEQLDRQYDLYTTSKDNEEVAINTVTIQSAKEENYPTAFSIVNKYGAFNSNEISTLL